MLVLSRKKLQAVIVGGSAGFQRLIKVTVLSVRGDQVKLGFEVDADVPVHRLEVWERIVAKGESLSRGEGPWPQTQSG